MTFDGRDYRDARYVMPYHYHSIAPDTGVAELLGLREVYLHARLHRGPLFVQTTPLNLRTPPTTAAASPIVRATAFQSVGGGDCAIPSSATHVVMAGIYSIGEATLADVFCRGVLYDGGTDTGATVTDQAPSAADRRAAYLASSSQVNGTATITPYGPLVGNMTTIVEVAIENVTPPNSTLCKYQMYATNPTTGTAVSIYPQLFIGWWEIRG